jgi:hypothetical protein
MVNSETVRFPTKEAKTLSKMSASWHKIPLCTTKLEKSSQKNNTFGALFKIDTKKSTTVYTAADFIYLFKIATYSS